MPLNRTELKYGAMKLLKAYEKIIWIIDLGEFIKGSLLVHPESVP